MIFEGLIRRVWPTITGQEALHFTRGNPTAPGGIPVHMNRYELLNPATGKKFWFFMGRHGNDIWIEVDPAGRIVHFDDPNTFLPGSEPQRPLPGSDPS